MAAFAVYTDLEARWKTLSSAEQETATVLLEDASVIIRAEVPGADDLDPDLTKLVSCGMVKRAMIAADSEGISQDNRTAGPFSQQRSYANPMGNLYLTKQDKRLLGIGGQRAFSIDLIPPTVEEEA
jgi:hypothetical protein